MALVVDPMMMQSVYVMAQSHACHPVVYMKY